MRPKSSCIWNYYQEVSSEKAKCKICGSVYSRKGRCTSGLITHLKLKHNNEYLKYEELRNKEPEKTSVSCSTPMQVAKKQITLKETLQKNDYWHSSHPKAIEIDKLIAEMLALQDLPFHFVQGIGFRRLMSAALPRYKLRGREHFTVLLCEDLYSQMSNKVKQLLEKFDKLSFTTDIWSDPSAGVSLLSLTAHGIAEDFRKMNIILKCEPMQGSHTGDVISEKILSMLNEWNISNKVHCIVHDKGSNMIRAMNLSQFTHINCTIHQLQLCIKAGLFSNGDIVQIIEKIKKIVTHFNHSMLAQDELRKIQTERLNQPPLTVVQDCPTRYFFNQIFH